MSLASFLNEKITVPRSRVQEGLRERGVVVSLAAIDHWISGKNTPRHEHLKALCDFLGLTDAERLQAYDLASAPTQPQEAAA